MSRTKALRIARTIFASACLAALAAPSYAEKVPPAPQLVQGGQMLLVGYEADPAAVRAALPRELEPLGNMVLMNMYTVPDATRTSGLGAYTLTYLTILVKGHDGYAVGSKDGLPGRYIMYYWNSSESMRQFTRGAGFPDNPGGVTSLEDGAGKVTTALSVDGKPFIQASADLSGKWGTPGGGQVNYLIGSGKSLARVPVPWVCSAAETSNPSVTFSMPANHPAAQLKPTKLLWAARMNCDIAYPQPVALAK